MKYIVVLVTLDSYAEGSRFGKIERHYRNDTNTASKDVVFYIHVYWCLPHQISFSLLL